MASTSLAGEFTSYALDKIRQNLRQIQRCVELLEDGDLWHRVNEHTNSIGNLVLHLTGNVRQWIVAGLGEEPFARDRPAEFAQREPLPRAEILDHLQHTAHRALEIIARLDEPDLVRRYTIQDYDVSALVAVFHVVEHFSTHTGQIVHMTKALRDVDLSVYDAHGHKPPGSGATP